MTSSKLICLFNSPAHYRLTIYSMLYHRYNCEIFFGDYENNRIKSFNLSDISSDCRMFKTKELLFGSLWMIGSSSLFLKKCEYFLITGEPKYLNYWIILIINRIRGVQTIIWSHGFYGRESFIKKVIKYIFFRLGHSLLLYNNFSKDIMIKLGFKSENLNVIYNSLNYSLHKSIRSNLSCSNIFSDHFGNDLPVVIFTGRITKSKKLSQIIDSLNILSQRHIYFNCLILGDGPFLSELRDYIDFHNFRSHFWLFGECYDEHIIGEFYFNSNVCVCPGSVGLTAIHSMTFGTPVVTNDNLFFQGPEFESITNDVTGSFFENDDIYDLASKIEFWISKNRDLNVIRRNCFDVVDSFYNPYYQIEVLNKVLNNN